MLAHCRRPPASLVTPIIIVSCRAIRAIAQKQFIVNKQLYNQLISIAQVIHIYY
jgi:hypothetical protein